MIERRRGVQVKKRVIIFTVLVLLPLTFDLGFFAAGLLPRPKAPEQVAPVDVIVVLTGGQGRLKEAMQLLENGKGKYLIISGTAPDILLKDILKANGLDALPTELRERILLDDDSRSTHENAVEIRRIVERLNAHTLLLVTSNYHVRRALQLFDLEFSREPRYQAILSAYPVESPNFEPGSWWKSYTGWKILLSEYLKSWKLRWIQRPASIAHGE